MVSLPTHVAAAHHHLQLFRSELICEEVVSHDQIKAVLEGIEVAGNALVQ